MSWRVLIYGAEGLSCPGGSDVQAWVSDFHGPAFVSCLRTQQRLARPKVWNALVMLFRSSFWMETFRSPIRRPCAGGPGSAGMDFGVFAASFPDVDVQQRLAMAWDALVILRSQSLTAEQQSDVDRIADMFEIQRLLRKGLLRCAGLTGWMGAKCFSTEFVKTWRCKMKGGVEMHLRRSRLLHESTNGWKLIVLTSSPQRRA